MSDNGEAAKPIPVLLALLVCDAAVMDPSSGKKSLIGIFERIYVGRFPTARAVSVYLKLTDALGEYELSIDFVASKSGMKIGDAKGHVRATNALESVDAYVPFPPLAFPEPGRYEFRVFTDSVYLGSAFIDAVPRPQPEAKT